MGVPRRLSRLTLDTLADLPEEVRGCVFWELDPVRRARAERAGETVSEKEAWLSGVLLDWGSCGRVAYVDHHAVGLATCAPPAYFPGALALPTAPIGEDALLLSTVWVDEAHRGGGLGRMLMQGVVRDVVERGGIRAVEAFGEHRPERARDGAAGSCLLPAGYLAHVGFKTQRAHPRQPRMRLEVSSAVTWRGEVEAALERLLGAVRPGRAVSPAPGMRTPG